MAKTKDKSRKGRRWVMALLAAAMLPALLVTAQAQSAGTKLESFEGADPVYTASVSVGSSQEDLGLPESLRAVAALEELGLDASAFVQAQPNAQEAQSYGYTAPDDADELYEAGEVVIYETEEQEYRVYGSVDEGENLWFVCDAAGNISGAILDVPVTWSGSYDLNTPGEYVLTASLSGYAYAGTLPTAVITVERDASISLLSNASLLTENAEDGAYIAEFTVTSIADGTADFDTDSDPESDYYWLATGNDYSDSNGIVRSFDTVTYDLSYRAASYDLSDEYESATLYFEFVLPMTETQAEWATDSMLWMDVGMWSITTETRSYDFDGNGTIDEDETDVSCQVLRGSRQLVATGSSTTVIPGTGTLKAVVQVLASSNGTEVTPVFTLWLEGNQTGGGHSLNSQMSPATA